MPNKNHIIHEILIQHIRKITKGKFFDSRDDMLLFLRKSYSSQIQFEISYFHLELNSNDIATNDYDSASLTVDEFYDISYDESISQ